MKRAQANFIHAYYESFCVEYERVSWEILDLRIYLLASVALNILLMVVWAIK